MKFEVRASFLVEIQVFTNFESSNEEVFYSLFFLNHAALGRDARTTIYFQPSVLNGEAGNPSRLMKFGSASSAQPKRTFFGAVTAAA